MSLGFWPIVFCVLFIKWDMGNSATNVEDNIQNIENSLPNAESNKPVCIIYNIYII